MDKASQETGIKVDMVNNLEGQSGFVPVPKRWPVEMDWSRDGEIAFAAMGGLRSSNSPDHGRKGVPRD